MTNDKTLFFVSLIIGVQSPGKQRTVVKNNQISSTNQPPLTSGGSVVRRCTISYEDKSNSMENSNLTSDRIPMYVLDHWSSMCGETTYL